MPQDVQRIEFEGQTHEFPSDFTDADIQKALSSHAPASASPAAQTPTAAAPAQTSWMDYGKDVAQRSVAGIGRGLENTYQFGKSLVSDVKSGTPVALSDKPADQGSTASRLQGESLLGKYILQPAAQEKQRALEEAQAMHQTSGLESVGHGITSMIHTAGELIPGVGPIVGSLVDRARTGDIAGAVSEGATYYGVGKAGKAVIDLPKEVNDLARRATSLNEVSKAGAGVYQGKVQPLIQTLQAVIQREGAKTLDQAIQADRDAQVVKGRGAISAGPAIAETAKAMEDTGHVPTPQTRNLLTRLNSQTEMTLEDAKNLRSDIGSAASRAERTGNAKLGKVLWTAYDEVGKGMRERIAELQGTPEPFDHYNNEFRAYYELNKGIAGKMQDPIMDRHEAIPQLKAFADSDLTELKQHMQKYGLKPEEMDSAQRDAKSLVGAHDALSGKMNKSLYRVMMGGGLPAAAAIAAYMVAHGAGVYGIVPLALSAYIGKKVETLPEQMEAGRILRKLNVKPEMFDVRTPVEGPKSFSYKNPDEGWSEPTKADLVQRAKTSRQARGQVGQK